MLALGIITLFLTGFMLIYYGYMAKNQERDVSFFLSVGIISMVMNLFTNSSATAVVLSVLYLIVALVFLGLGFAVNLETTLSFYKSIGPWFKKTFTDKETIGWNILSFCVAPAGIALYFVNHRKDRYFADRCGRLGMWGLLIWLLLIWMICGAVSGASAAAAVVAAL